jgi:hypothetical protein
MKTCTRSFWMEPAVAQCLCVILQAVTTATTVIIFVYAVKGLGSKTR